MPCLLKHKNCNHFVFIHLFGLVLLSPFMELFTDCFFFMIIDFFKVVFWVVHLTAEFQRIARRDKAFLSDQCKEIEGHNRMGKTSEFFKKIKYMKEKYHAKLVTIKDRNGMDLRKAEDIKKI